MAYRAFGLLALGVFFLLGTNSGPATCPDCAPYRPAAFTIQRVHFPVNGPAIVDIAPFALPPADDRPDQGYFDEPPGALKGLWFAQADEADRDPLLGRIDSYGGVRFVQVLNPIGMRDEVVPFARYCPPLVRRDIALHTDVVCFAGATSRNRRGGGESVRIDRTGTIWTIRNGALFILKSELSSSGHALAVVENPTFHLNGKPSYFLASWGSAYIATDDGEVLELLGPVAAPRRINRPSSAAVSPGSSEWYLASPTGVSPDGTLWTSSLDGIYYGRPGHAPRFMRFYPELRMVDGHEVRMPLEIAPDGAAWTVAYDRVCRINDNEEVQCADAPPFGNAGPRDWASPNIYRFSSDGVLSYVRGHEILRLTFGTKASDKNGLPGDFDIVQTPLERYALAQIAYGNNRLVVTEQQGGGIFGNAASFDDGLSFQTNRSNWQMTVCGVAIGRSADEWYPDCREGIWNGVLRTHLPDHGRAVAIAAVIGKNPWVVERYSSNGIWHDRLIEIADDQKTIAHGILPGFARTLRVGADAKLYVQMDDGTLFQIERGVPILVRRNVTNTFAIDRSGAVWIPGVDSLIELRHARKSIHRLPIATGGPDTPTALSFSKDGALWFGHGGQLCRYGGSLDRCIRLDPGMRIRQIVFGSHNDVWMLIDDHRIARYQYSPR